MIISHRGYELRLGLKDKAHAIAKTMKVIDVPTYQCPECFAEFETILSEDHTYITFTHPSEAVTGVKCDSAVTFIRASSEFETLI